MALIAIYDFKIGLRFLSSVWSAYARDDVAALDGSSVCTHVSFVSLPPPPSKACASVSHGRLAVRACSLEPESPWQGLPRVPGCAVDYLVVRKMHAPTRSRGKKRAHKRTFFFFPFPSFLGDFFGGGGKK